MEDVGREEWKCSQLFQQMTETQNCSTSLAPFKSPSCSDAPKVPFRITDTDHNTYHTLHKPQTASTNINGFSCLVYNQAIDECAQPPKGNDTLTAETSIPYSHRRQSYIGYLSRERALKIEVAGFE